MSAKEPRPRHLLLLKPSADPASADDSISPAPCLLAHHAGLPSEVGVRPKRLPEAEGDNLNQGLPIMPHSSLDLSYYNS